MSTPVELSYAEYIKTCQQCLIDCKVCLAKMAGKKSMNECPYCCVQCIQVLQASIGLMAVDSQFAPEQCALCAKICDYCAEICGAHDHEHCQRCAESCRKCAEMCRRMDA